MRLLFATYSILIALPLVSLVAQPAGNSIDLLDELARFTAQKKQQLDEQLEQNSEENGQQARYAAQGIERQLIEIRSITQELNKVRIYTKRSNYKVAQQSVQRLESKISSNLDSERALEAFIELSGEIEALQQNAHEIWYEEIDAVIKEAREACINAETSDDLDSLLIKIAALEMKRPSSSKNIVVTRGTDKVRGTVSTLQSWMRYLDHRRAGNAKAANDALKQLERNTSNYPLLSQDDIADKWLKVTVPEDANKVAVSIMSDIRKPSDVAQAIQAFEAALKDPRLSNQNNISSQVIPQLINYKSAFDALEQDDFETAQSISKSLRSYYGRTDLRPYFDNLKEQLSNDLIVLKLKQVSDKKVDTSKPIAAEVDRIIAELWEEEELLKVKDILEAQPRSVNSQSGILQNQIRMALNEFLTAKEFEKADDYATAYLYYRNTLRKTGTEHPLNKFAINALKRLRDSQPELISHFDDSALIQEIQGLREDIQRLERSEHFMRRR